MSPIGSGGNDSRKIKMARGVGFSFPRNSKVAFSISNCLNCLSDIYVLVLVDLH